MPLTPSSPSDWEKSSCRWGWTPTWYPGSQTTCQRPQLVRLKNGFSDTVVTNTGAPQGTVLSPVLFTLYTSDFCYNATCRRFRTTLQLWGVSGMGRRRSTGAWWMTLCNGASTTICNSTLQRPEMLVDFCRSKPTLLPVCIEVVNSYKYLGIHLDNKLDWSADTDALCKKGQSRLCCFKRRLRSFNVCSKLLCTFYQSAVASVIFYAVVCWGGSIKKKDAGRLDRLVKKAGSVAGLELEGITAIAEKRTLNGLLTILDKDCHPLHSTFTKQRSMSSSRLRTLSYSTDRLGK